MLGIRNGEGENLLEKVMDALYGGVQARRKGAMPDFVTVASGLPRSGTSLMMQMLAAGGLGLLTDGARAPDEDNPHGYFEFEPVKRTRQDASWVRLARGKAVKVVYLLLPDLPDGFEYRVILMRRPIGEVMRSQTAMMRRLGGPDSGIGEERLGEIFTRQLGEVEKKIVRRPAFHLLPVEYHDCLHRTGEVVAALSTFLDRPLDAAAMTAAIDLALHRNR